MPSTFTPTYADVCFLQYLPPIALPTFPKVRESIERYEDDFQIVYRKAESRAQ